jgi:hypothetical protein
MRQWNPVTLRAAIAALDQALRERPSAKQTELWRMRKGKREIRCVVEPGIDLRLLENDGVWRTELFQDAPRLHRRAAEWQHQCAVGGWRSVEADA